MPQTLDTLTHAESASVPASRLDAAARVQARLASLRADGILRDVNDYALEAKIAKRSIDAEILPLKSERATTESKWRQARKAENYVLADKLKRLLDAMPADNSAAISKLHAVATALAPLQIAGAEATDRVAYRAYVNALVRAHK